MSTPRRQKLIVIVGPTASGKSELAVRLAKKFDGEIVSADSQQIYRGFNIGTAKVKGRWHKNAFVYKGVTHHCIDFVSPKKTFTAAEFGQCAVRAIKAIARRGKTPILAGGTGFWIDTLVYNLPLPAVAPNKKLRAQLEGKTPTELLKILKKLDSERAKTIEQKNPRRLIRAIEITKTLGSVPRLDISAYRNNGISPYNTLWLGLHPSYDAWRRKIVRRTNMMLSEGLIRETKRLFRQGVSKKRIRGFGFEYHATLNYLEKKITKKALYEQLLKDTLAYARRQMVWFKRNPHIQWICHQQGAEKIIKSFLKKI